jgi:hypothetical protein
LNSISIALIYAIAAKTSWLPENPMLWFVMMLMPAGPSAMKVMVLADVADAEQKDKMVIAKFLAVSNDIYTGGRLANFARSSMPYRL